MTYTITVDRDLPGYIDLPVGSVVTASTHREAMDQLSERYQLEYDAWDKALFRMEGMIKAVDVVQRSWIVGHEGEFDQLSDGDLDLILTPAKYELAPAIEWNHAIPLIAIGDAFEQDWELPTGNVWLVFHRNEHLYLDSLHNLGIITLEQSDEKRPIDIRGHALDVCCHGCGGEILTRERSGGSGTRTRQWPRFWEWD